MAVESLIAWTTNTWNPFMGCTKVSPGCTHCYAETLTTNRMGLHIWGPKAPRRLTTESYWQQPFKWNREAEAAGERQRVFCASLCDWAEDHSGQVISPKGDPYYFKSGVTPVTRKSFTTEPFNAARFAVLDNIRLAIWETIRQTPWLDWQMLTKRTDRIQQLLPADWGDHGYQNVWLGTSIESNDYAYRADILREIPAVVRFISYEPALGPLDQLDLTGIDWVIFGGESGSHIPKSPDRVADLEWSRQMHRMCAASPNPTGTAYFHKQSSGIRTEMGIELDGQIVREYPTPRIVPRKERPEPSLFTPT